MKIQLRDVNLLILDDISAMPPGWFTPDLEFDFPIQVKAGKIVLSKEYGGKDVVVLLLWKSSNPSINEPRIGEVFFMNTGSKEMPEVSSISRMIGNQIDGQGDMQTMARVVYEGITRDLFSLRDGYEEGRLEISHKIDKAKNYIKKFSYEKAASFSVYDPSILAEARRQVEGGKAVLIVEYFDRMEYEVYVAKW